MSHCPTDKELERYTAGEMAAEETARVRTHISTCTACAEREKALWKADEDLLADLRGIGSAGIADLRAQPDRSDHNAGQAKAPAAASLAIEGYQIVGELHRGGQGIVYEALQERTKRSVAIKVLLEGQFASHAARRRFEREIELAAQLVHPNIVTIFHSGETADGRQYCVMDYVRGRRLDEYVREEKLPLEGVLGLFATVCDAVVYAHQRGIIHRDLKPSNVLVDESGSPRILDFGLAKRTIGTPDTFASLSGQVFGTLQYMSPEQTTGKPEATDTRSDIYSLGVILYELLTGRFPYPVEEQLADVLRHITDTPPSPPTRVWDSKSGVVGRSARRPDSIKCPLDDEIETIVLKTLAKEPERRYQTALELASDLRHYLAGEPIAAKRDSNWYVLQKTIRRYKLRFAAALVIFALTAASTVALSVMYGKQGRLLDQVRTESERALAAEKVASAEKERAVASERVAQRRFEQVRELARTFIFDFHDLIVNLKGATPRELIVTTALTYLDGLAAESAGDPSLQRELAFAYQKVGDVQGASGAANLGDSEGAEASYCKALAVFEGLARRDPDSIAARSELADCHDKLGNLRMTVNKTTDALADYRAAFDIYRSLTDSDLENIDLRRGLARAHMKIGDVQIHTGESAEARRSFQQAVELQEHLAAESPDDPGVQRDLSLACGRFGDAQAALGDRDAALASHRRRLEISERLAAAEPENARTQRDLAVDCDAVGDMLRNAGKLDEALALYRNGMRIRTELVAADPHDAEASRDLTNSYNRLGSANRRLGRMEDAEATYRQGLEIVNAWAADHPDDVRPQKALRVFYTTIGYCESQRGDNDGALISYRGALDIARELAAANPDSARAQRDLSVGYYRMAGTQAALGEQADALANFERCREIREKLAEADPDNVMYQRNLAEVCFELGDFHATVGGDESLPLADRLASWRQARANFQQAHNIHTAQQEAGTLLSYDVNMPAVETERLAECDAAITELE